MLVQVVFAGSTNIREGIMGKISRDRGAKFEREIANIFKDWGYEAFRTAQHMGKTGQTPDVKIDYLHAECKRRRSVAVYEWYDQARRDALAEGKGNIPVVFFRADGKPPMAMMHIESFIELFSEYYAGRKMKEDEDDRENGKI